ncbi:MAG: hypothetical protein IKZ47_01140 [Clostridia bacterium]|nr:hypothetical protein [Clostridia bacterium]
MKNNALKITVLCLCAALVLSAAGVAAFARINNSENAKQQTARITSMKAPEEAEVTKDETVYVIAGADGAVSKIIVSDWIKNAIGAETVEDSTQLENTVNVNGNETYEMGGENSRVWDAHGNDIYYQGNIEKELPVTLKVSYKLDGVSITPDMLKGKSGKITIRFDYQNRQYETVNIGGTEQRIYVPFAMLTGLILDNDTFKNVEVSNGKLINDGSRTVVAGLAFPGLQQNLDIDPEKFQIPDHIEITADVQNFSLGMTVTVATNGLFGDLDTDRLNDVTELNSSLTELSDAMKQLIDGSSKLYDGLCTLLDKSKELVSGINQLAAGAGALKEGASRLDGGIGELQNGVNELSGGLELLASNNDTLNSGAAQVFGTLLATAKTQMTAAGLTVPDMTPENYAAVLNTVIDSLDDEKVYAQALKTVTEGVEANRGYIEAQVTAAVTAQVEAGVTAAVRENVAAGVIAAATGMDKDDYDQAVSAGLVDATTQTAINNAVDAQMATDDIKALIAQNTAAKMGTEEIEGLIVQNTEAQVQKAIADTMAGEEVQAKLAAASSGAAQVIALKTSLDSYNAFYLGLKSYTAGVAQAAVGAAQLKDGAAQLKEGSAQLSAGADEFYNGILTMKNGAPALVSGVTQLRDGGMMLSSGLKEFNEKGVQKLVSAVRGNVGELIERLKATVKVSENYRNFAGIADGMDGQVKFIYRTEEIAP